MFFQSLLPVGSTAPEFSLLNQVGETVRLADFRGQHGVILVFYPADFTPVCTAQLSHFQDNYAELKKDGFEVLGINPANFDKHAQFARKYGFCFPLLYDPEFRVAKQYNAVLIPFVLNNRVVYAIDQEGIIRFAKRGNPPVSEIREAFAVQKSGQP